MRRGPAPLCLLVVLQLCPAQVPARRPGEATLHPCGDRSDPLCVDKRGPGETEAPAAAGHLPAAEELPIAGGPAAPGVAPSAARNASEFAPPEDAGRNIIPVYCSILAAVVVGLLAYVAFKCWHTCKQKQQLAKARAGELAPAPEGEKLHSDSGVFLDTHSLQESHQLSKAPRPYSAVPPARREELERLLESGGEWRALAARLGYEAEAVGAFARGQAPARTLLAAWAAADGATVEALGQALAAIGRPDAAERLAAPADASSLV
ncbi:death domain-containing membrane protein NRADD-like [Rhea pennata]|uniref:death domain-containing membrane protein NRADD-like n=1 Tax=Rhea pennata TaxID=8795 RepID=UPI002E254888